MRMMYIMVINLDCKKREAIYEQIVSEIERYVSLGVLKPNEKIPSVRVMALDLGINPNTVKKAYDILEDRGVIVTLSTKGTFISENIDKVKREKEKDLINKINDLIKELEKFGLSKEQIFEKLKSLC